jgi:hypothetical protein
MRNRERGAVFRQSNGDFPQMVTLGEKSPSFGLHRFKQGLRFIPVDDEGFTLRGDKQRLLYKGRRRSHRFTIHGDCSFEYDCILNKEPDSNVIALRIEGAGQYDFFRQPDFVKDPYLQGSYAVYKKETLIGEGTGKICHIHRPLIIDAIGRRCWGTLAVVGNMLYITIPEKWLADAKYPVVVDPTIGTTTVGSLYEYNAFHFVDAAGFEYDLNYPLGLDNTIILNKVLVPESMGELGTFYVYKNDDNSFDARDRIINTCPCIYNDVNNLPNTRISANEGAINDIYRYRQAGWLNAGISKNSPINEGDYIWFGIRGTVLTLRFDYGGLLERIYVYRTFTNYNKLLPDVLGESYYSPFTTEDTIRELRISMYIDYEKGANNYIKRLVQGVTLNDNNNFKADYKRTFFQQVNGSDVPHTLAIFFRQCVMNISISEGLEKIQRFSRSVIDKIEKLEIIHNSREVARKCNENVGVNGEAGRSKGFYRLVSDFFTGSDNSNFTILFVRCVNETKGISDGIRKWGDYIRSLFIQAGNIAETDRIGKFYRKENDKVTAKGSVLRKIFYVLKIITKACVRDYIIGRFLIAREELTLKSCVVREICIESRIN